MRPAKIIATVGPASASYSVLRKMMRAGMDVVRLNFSHGTQAELFRVIGMVRLLNERYGRHLRLLGDLQGHRIRVGRLPAPRVLKKRQTVVLTNRPAAGAADIPFDYTGSLDAITKGCQIFIDDGNIALEVQRRVRGGVQTRVVVGGLLKEHKGINIPQAKLAFGAISAKDVKDIRFCREHGVEYVAQSFVRSARDVREVRKALGAGSSCRVVAKIENCDGIRNIEAIISVSDGVMIARGDMGVSLPVYQVPVIQKMIIAKCKRAGKFAITATQMLESMTENLRPTRAEVTDVANALLDGSDFLMLSAETAAGAHPVEAVAMMDRVMKYTAQWYEKR